MANQDIALSRIRTDGGTQIRVDLDPATIEDYAADMLDGDHFPPIVVFFDGADYWLADGFHRLEAAGKAKLDRIKADVRKGTCRDAVLFSVGANSGHGLRRTNEDKRRAVLTLLKDQEWAQWSDNEIARRCQVSQPFVGKLRAELSENGFQIPKKRTASRGGKQPTVNTSQSGVPPGTPDIIQPGYNGYNLPDTTQSGSNGCQVIGNPQSGEKGYSPETVRGRDGKIYPSRRVEHPSESPAAQPKPTKPLPQPEEEEETPEEAEAQKNEEFIQMFWDWDEQLSIILSRRGGIVNMTRHFSAERIGAAIAHFMEEGEERLHLAAELKEAYEQ